MKVLSVTSTFVDFHFLSGAVFLGRNTLVIGDILWSHNIARWGHFLVQLKKKKKRDFSYCACLSQIHPCSFKLLFYLNLV